MDRLLGLFLALRLAQQAAEHALAALNRRYGRDPARQAEAARDLAIAPGEMAAADRYAEDRYRFGVFTSWIDVLLVMAFLASGILGRVESVAQALTAPFGLGEVGVGLAFFAILGMAGALYGLPFGLYETFVIEERHGFNRQTLGGFFLDRLKGLVLGAALGGPLLAAVLWLIAHAGPRWWLWAWALVTGWGVLTAWIYPTFLAPIFNEFTPLPEGELRDGILALAQKVGFRAGGLFVMDASRRTAHGNAYFTGLFGAKRIVLFDTLLDALGTREALAVLAHELGHFKLRHVRAAILRSVLAQGALFMALAWCLPRAPFYEAFGLGGPSGYGALLVFGAWFGLAGFLLRPLAGHLSRRNELAADAFAVRNGASASELGDALLKLREKSRLFPLSHPLYSRVYHSHPPLLERLRALAGR